MYLEKDWPSSFQPSHIPRKTPLGLRKVGVSFGGSVWTFVSEKGIRKRESEKGQKKKERQKECKWAQLSGTISHADRERLFLLSELCVAWTLSSIEIQYRFLPTQTMTALNRLAFNVMCFLHQGASITQLGRRRQKALFFTPARVQSPLGFYSMVLH